MTNETAIFLQLHSNITGSRIGIKAGLNYGKEHNHLWADYLRRQCRPLIEGYYHEIADSLGKTELVFWGEKHPHFHKCLDFLLELYPAAAFLYVLRDPRDSACSIARMNGVAFHDALLNWKRFSRHYEQFVTKNQTSKLVTLRYEDLVEDYTGVTERLLKELGLAMHRNVRKFLSRHREKDVESRGFRRWITEKKDYASQSKGRWKKELSAADQELAKRMIGDFLEKYEYQ